MKWSDGDAPEVPPGVVTATSTVPAVPDGEVAVRVVSLVKPTPVAARPPKVTVESAVKPAPVMVTGVPPARGPSEGATAVTLGALLYVNWSALTGVVMPPSVVTTTSNWPAGPGGEVAVRVAAPT